MCLVQESTLYIEAFDHSVMHVHGNTGPIVEIELQVKLRSLRPHPVLRLQLSEMNGDNEIEKSYTKLIIPFPDIGDIQVFVVDCRSNTDLANISVHGGEDILQPLLVGFQVQADIRDRRADAFDALCLDVVLCRRAQILRNDVQVWRLQ